MKRKRRLLTIFLVSIGVPCLVVQTAHQIANFRRQSEIDRVFRDAENARARLDQAKAADSGPDEIGAAQMALTEALYACLRAMDEPRFISNWFRIVTAFGFFVAFWGLVILAFKKKDSNTRVS
jgi:hypothetical protein